MCKLGTGSVVVRIGIMGFSKSVSWERIVVKQNFRVDMFLCGSMERTGRWNLQSEALVDGLRYDLPDYLHLCIRMT